MTAERSRTATPTATTTGDPATPFCIGCGTPLDTPRCPSCGAAKVAGGHRLLRVLHESDHARVYLAEDAAGRRVALKELIFSRAPDAQTIEAFHREAGMLRDLSHPAIPRLVGSFTEGEGVHTRLYLAQEHVEGESLADLAKAHRFTEAEALDVARQVLPILRYLHSLSPLVVHRDVKPANLIRRADGTYALVDFGTAREVAPRGTHRATAAGTFGYMPPEALGGTLDRTADLYGLGATLVHLLARRPPEDLLFSGDDDLAAHLNVSPGTLGWLRAMTDPARARRFQSAEAALAAIEPQQPGRSRSRGRSRRPQRGSTLPLPAPPRWSPPVLFKRLVEDARNPGEEPLPLSVKVILAGLLGVACTVVAAAKAGNGSWPWSVPLVSALLTLALVALVYLVGRDDE